MYNNTHIQVQNEVEKFEETFTKYPHYEFEDTLRELNSIEGLEPLGVEWTGDDIEEDNLMEF